MNRSVAEVGGSVLVVSQFTLYGDTRKGRRPSWVAAAPPEQAEPLVDAVVDALRDLGATVATGMSGWSLAGIGDYDNDGTADIAFQNATSGTVTRFDMQDGLAAARKAAERGVRVFTVGLGSPDGAITSFGGFSMRVQLDEDTLRRVADMTRGQYFRANTAAEMRADLDRFRRELKTDYIDTNKIKFVFRDEAAARVGSATDSLVSHGCIISGGRIHRSKFRGKEKAAPGKHKDIVLTLDWMDAMGVDYACLFPTQMLFLGAHPQVEVEVGSDTCYLLSRDRRLRRSPRRP